MINILKDIEALGLKITQGRKTIGEILNHAFAQGEHPDAETVALRARSMEGHPSQASVYRLLDSLVEEGILREHSFGDGRRRFDYNIGDNHGHIVNMATGEITDFESPEIKKAVKDVAENAVSHAVTVYV